MQISELLAKVEVVGIPTRTNFRGVQVREIALIKGARGWGEFSPFADYSLERDALWLQSAIEASNHSFPEPIRKQVRVNATLPEVPSSRVGEVLSWFPGSTTVKVKVGTANDLERIHEVFQIIPNARLRLDANGLFTIHEAEEFLTSLYNKYGHQIEYVEQPCTSLAENAAVQLPVPIAIDENVRLGDDIHQISKVADIVIIKVAPLGGIARAQQIISALDKPVVISSALESSIGMAAGIALAAHLQEEITCGLGTVALLDGDLALNSFLPENGAVSVHELNVSDEQIAHFRLPQEHVTKWHNRISAAYTHLLGKKREESDE